MNNTSILIDSNNKDNNDDEDKNTILFFKIWRNLCLKNIIIFKMKLFNIHYFKRIYNFEIYKNYKFKEYFRSIRLDLRNVTLENWNLEYLNLPANIKELDMGIEYRDQFKNIDIPNNLKIESFQFSYRSTIPAKPEIITPHLKNLILSSSFNQPLCELFSSTNNTSLTSLNLGCDFNSPIQVGVLPPNLKYLKFSDRFNHVLVSGTLPSSLTWLHLGVDFNNPLLPLDLPDSLTYIHFSTCFNQPISYGKKKHSIPILPQKLKYVRFGSQFFQHINKGDLPDSLEQLVAIIGNSGGTKGYRLYPSPNLKSLTIGGSFIHCFYYPKPLLKSSKLLNLKIIYLDKTRSNFDFSRIVPNSVTSLCLSINDLVIKKNSLPNSIKKLKVLPNVVFQPNSIPPSLTEIHGCYLNSIKAILPLSITKYALPPLSTNPAIDLTLQSLPKNITLLKLKDIPLFTNILFSMNHITTLIIDPINSFIGENSFKLPPLLLYLSWGYEKIPSNSEFLPQTLQLLELGPRFNHPISNEWLPTSLSHLIVKGRGVVESLPSGMLGLYTFSQPLNNNSIGFLETLVLTPDIINILHVLNSDYNIKPMNIFKILINQINKNNQINQMNNLIIE